jgi:hypothetical protein
VGGWISQSDEIVKDHTSCGDFSACLWPLVHGPQQNSSPNNIFNLPEVKSLPGDDVPVPYYIVGDNAFGINKRLMNPFAIRNMEHHERIFLVHGPQQNSELVCQNTKGILHYTPGSGESVVKYSLMTKYFWVFTMRGQGTLEPRRGDKLEDTWATTLPQRLVRCHGRTR